MAHSIHLPTGQRAIEELNKISTVDRLIYIGKALKEWHKDAFSLSEINRIMSRSTIPDDFNAFELPFLTYKDVHKAIQAAERTLVDDNAPWLMLTCECGGRIYLTRKMLAIYRMCDLPLPVFYDDCMKKNRRTVLDEAS